MNEVVTRAAADNQPVLPCFIIDPWFYQQLEIGKARVKFLFESLENLDHNLRARGSQLYLFEGNSATILQILTYQLLAQGHHLWGTDNNYFIGGETQATATLDSFLSSRFHGYHWKVSRPWLTQQGATSHLSPHLTFGTISVRQVYQRTKAKAAELENQPKAQFSLKTFRDAEGGSLCDHRLRWHDSFTQRLYSHPELAHTNRYCPEFLEDGYAVLCALLF